VNFLRTTSTRRLIAGAALTVAVVVGGVAVATASSSNGTPPPPKPLDVAIHDGLAAPKPAGVTARIRFVNNLISTGAVSTGSPLLSGATGRLWVSGGRVRLELQSDAGDAQITFADGHLSIYDAASNTVYRADVGSSDSTATTTGQDHAPPSLADISSALQRLAQQATVSGAEPTTQAGQGAYKVTVTPKHDAGLLGQAEFAWDAANGIPLRIAVTAAGSSSPVLALEVTDISYGSVDPSTLAVTPPAGAKVVDLGSPAHAGSKDSGGSAPTQGLTAVQAAVPFTLEAPDTLVGLPRTGVRLVSDGKDPAALVTYGQGLGAIAVLERSAGKADGGTSPLDGLPTVTIDGATGHELPTALGTLISVERAGLSTTLVGSLPPNAAEAALREVLG
jgi:outer membrane lipoprotein-sorting protein